MSKVIEELKKSSDPLNVELSMVLEHWQSNKAQRGLTARLGFEPRDIRDHGAVNVISARVRKGASGYDEVDQDKSYEAIVLKYDDRFSADVITAARLRLKKLSYWWVNHKQTFAQEVGGNYIWSPLTKSDGGKNKFYENMRNVRAGDIVFSYADAAIKAVGICTVPAFIAPKPGDFGAAGGYWSDEGWQVTVAFTKLTKLLLPKEHMDVLAPLLPPKYSPIRSSGDGNQGAYLANISAEMAEKLTELLDTQWPAIVHRFTEISTDEGAALEEADLSIEARIKNRTDLTETERLQLVHSRRGHGTYRRNLENFEKCCRITGVSNLDHLRASHIKPWRISTTFEKLDGNNGLLLSPHVDHLFDRGYISFSDEGKILVSDFADQDTIEKWGIDLTATVGSFRSEQLPYLAFHRESIFKR